MNFGYFQEKNVGALAFIYVFQKNRLRNEEVHTGFVQVMPWKYAAKEILR